MQQPRREITETHIRIFRTDGTTVTFDLLEGAEGEAPSKEELQAIRAEARQLWKEETRLYREGRATMGVYQQAERVKALFLELDRLMPGIQLQVEAHKLEQLIEQGDPDAYLHDSPWTIEQWRWALGAFEKLAALLEEPVMADGPTMRELTVLL